MKLAFAFPGMFLARFVLGNLPEENLATIDQFRVDGP